MKISKILSAIVAAVMALTLTACNYGTTVSETPSSSSSEPVYGSMGFVTIQGVEYDIATTTELNLSGRGLTDEDIKPLSGLTNLTWLDLEDNQISDISALSGLTNLTHLELSYNQISKADQRWLEEKLPNCYITCYLVSNGGLL